MDKSYFTGNRFYYLLAIILIIIFYILANSGIYRNPSSSPFSILVDKHSNSKSAKYTPDDCQWKFDHYSPSPWEIYWYSNIATLQNRVCPTLQQPDQKKKSISALEYIIKLQKKIYNETLVPNEYDELFSKMFYRFECPTSPKSNRLVSQYVEPLIGLLRDPSTICSYSDLPANIQIHGDSAIQSKRFFLLGPSAPYYNFRTLTPAIAPWLYKQGSQTILFDIGASLFNGVNDAIVPSSVLGTRWFYEYFRSTSLHFDRIVAFEVSQFAPRTYWNQIPDDIIGSLTFINNGVEKTGKFNPWNILKSIANINDYVIIKLDIDTPLLETELINQVLNDTSISSLIDEMFFEMHVSINEMRMYWGAQPGELKDTYVLFTKLRQLGIRMHSWP